MTEPVRTARGSALEVLPGPVAHPGHCPEESVLRRRCLDQEAYVNLTDRREESRCMFLRVMYTTVFVRDQEEALDFYTGNLGFVKRRDHRVPEAAAWALGVGRFLTVGFRGQDLEVILAPATRGPDDKDCGHSLLDRGELFVESDDLKKDYERLQSNGVQFVEPAPEDYPFGVRVTALDPDGNPVSLRQRPNQ